MLIYGELGTEEQIVSGLRRGRVHFANLSANIAATVVPDRLMDRLIASQMRLPKDAPADIPEREASRV